MKSAIITLTSMLLATSAFADCATPKDVLFRCEFDTVKKAVEICLLEGEGMPEASYSFGKIGQKPELFLTRVLKPYGKPDQTYFTGNNWEEEILYFRNGDFEYEAYDLPDLETITDSSPEPESEIGLTVTKNGNELMNLACNKASYQSNWEIFNSRLAALGYTSAEMGWAIQK